MRKWTLHPLAIAAFAAAVLFGFDACSSANSRVVGSWETPDQFTGMTFNADGTGSEQYDDNSFTLFGGSSSLREIAFTYSVTSEGTVVMNFGMQKMLASLRDGKLFVEGANLQPLRRVQKIVLSRD